MLTDTAKDLMEYSITSRSVDPPAAIPPVISNLSIISSSNTILKPTFISYKYTLRTSIFALQALCLAKAIHFISLLIKYLIINYPKS